MFANFFYHEYPLRHLAHKTHGFEPVEKISLEGHVDFAAITEPELGS